MDERAVVREKEVHAACTSFFVHARRSRIGLPGMGTVPSTQRERRASSERKPPVPSRVPRHRDRTPGDELPHRVPAGTCLRLPAAGVPVQIDERMEASLQLMINGPQ
jgi:hypothetical protein